MTSISTAGWNTASRASLGRVTLLLLLSFAGSVQAAEQAPDMALLEFLGEWEQDDGRWIDPLRMQELARLDADNIRDGAKRNEGKPDD